MRNSILIKGVGSLLVLVSAQAIALPFNSLDPRSLSMGGAGVASGTAANAGFMNPALLAVTKEDESFAVELPIVGGRLYDPDDVRNEIDDFQDGGYAANLDAAISTFNAAQTDENAQAVADAAQALQNQLLKVAGKPMQAEVLAGLVVGIPSRRIGASLTADVQVVGEAKVNYLDQATIDAMIAAGNAVPNTLSGNTITSSQLQSNLEARGIQITEIGLSLAREFNLFGTPVAVGVTPKYMKVTTFDYVQDVNSAEFKADLGEKEYSDGNLDIGLAKDYKNGWKTGLVAKNLISRDYETVLGNKVKIEPQLRAGVSHSTDWSTVALDVDLKENDPVAFSTKAQYIGLGAELDVFDLMHLRIGYRHNMKDSKTSIPTVGLGFSPFGAHLDFSAGTNGDETALSMQLGYRF